MHTSDHYSITAIDDTIRTLVQPLIDTGWAGPYIAISGSLWDTRILPGIAAIDESGAVIGYLLYDFQEFACEIMALESLRESIGVGTGLLERIKKIAKDSGMQKVIVVTTNDNIKAFRFYQKHGFTLRAVRLNILETCRKIKPEIPLQCEGIPLRDELELEISI